MSINQRPRIGAALAALLLAASTMSWAVTGSPAEDSSAAPAVDEEAMALLLRMANFLADAPRFSVSIRSGYDVVQASGQKIEFGESRHIVVDRPTRMRVDNEMSDGSQRQILFDGKTVTVSSPLQKTYAQTEQPGDVDKTLHFFKQKLHLRMPLAPLLMKSLATDLKGHIYSLASVETTKLDGVVTHHLVARSDTVDLQVWIADGEQPLPRRVILTYRDANQQPQYWADFSDWNLAPPVNDALFSFTPPAGTNKIAFINQITPAAAPAAAGAKP